MARPKRPKLEPKPIKRFCLVPTSADLIVRDPTTFARLPSKADASIAFNRKPVNSYWRRQIKAGAVVEVKETDLPEAPKAKPKAKPEPKRARSPAVGEPLTKEKPEE